MNTDGPFFILTCGVFVLLVAFGLGSAFLLLAETVRARGAARRLAPDVGMASLAGESPASRPWYGGEHAGRPVAVRVIGLRTHATAPDAQRWRIALRVVMGLELDAPLAQPVVSHMRRKRVPEDFERAFHYRGDLTLAPDSRAAMLDFVGAGYPWRRKRDRVLGWGKRTRELMLLDRADESEVVMPAEILPDTHTMLLHDHEIPNLSPEALRALLDEMAALAEAIERDAP